MKSETLPEAHARMKAMSDAEKEGATAATEGQLQPARNPALDERAQQLDDGDPERLERLEEVSRSGGDMIRAGTQDQPVDPDWALTAHRNTAEGEFGQNAPRAAGDRGGRKASGARGEGGGDVGGDTGNGNRRAATKAANTSSRKTGGKRGARA